MKTLIITLLLFLLSGLAFAQPLVNPPPGSYWNPIVVSPPDPFTGQQKVRPRMPDMTGRTPLNEPGSYFNPYVVTPEPDGGFEVRPERPSLDFNGRERRR